MKTSILLAALQLAPKKDIRYYMVGVHLRPGVIEASDGYLVGCFRVPEVTIDTIIPYDAVKALNPRIKETTVALTSDGFIEIAQDQTITRVCPVEGKFPDIKRVIPMDDGGPTVERQYSAELIGRMAKALGIFTGNPSFPNLRMHTTEKFSSAVCLCAVSADFVGVIRPLNDAFPTRWDVDWARA